MTPAFNFTKPPLDRNKMERKGNYCVLLHTIPQISFTKNKMNNQRIQLESYYILYFLMRPVMVNTVTTIKPK